MFAPQSVLARRIALTPSATTATDKSLRPAALYNGARVRVPRVWITKTTEFGAGEDCKIAFNVRGRNFATDDSDGIVLAEYMNPDFVGIKSSNNEDLLLDKTSLNGTGIAISSLPANAAVVVGFRAPIDKVTVDMLAGTVNGTAGTLKQRYLTSAGYTALTAVDSDGSAAGGAPWAQDGVIALFASNIIPAQWRTVERLGPVDFVKTYGYPLWLIELASTGAIDSSAQITKLTVKPAVNHPIPFDMLEQRDISNVRKDGINHFDADEVLHIETTDAAATVVLGIDAEVALANFHGTLV